MLYLYYLPMPRPGSINFLSPPSLLHPILVRLRRRLLRLPCPHQVDVCLLPPPHPHPCPWCPLRPLTQVQKWSRSNVMNGHVLPSPNVLLHCLKTRLLPCRCHRGVLPLTVCQSPWYPPYQMPRHLVLEPPPRNLPIQGVNTNVSATKGSTALTTALQGNPDTSGSDPFLLNILFILFRTTIFLAKFRTTAKQSLSAAKITLPRYWKEVTISRGRP